MSEEPVIRNLKPETRNQKPKTRNTRAEPVEALNLKP
jgi:hypothetical protein